MSATEVLQETYGPQVDELTLISGMITDTVTDMVTDGITDMITSMISYRIGGVQDSGAAIADYVATSIRKYNNSQMFYGGKQIQFAISIVNDHLWHQMGCPNWIDFRRESHLHQLYAISSKQSMKADKSPTSTYGYVPIQWANAEGS